MDEIDAIRKQYAIKRVIITHLEELFSQIEAWREEILHD